MTGYDWEGDQPLQPDDAGDGHLRDARPRVHEVADLGRVASRDVPRASSTRSRTSRSLGVTAVELLPVFEFDEDEISGTNPLTGQRLINYWGYSPISFFNPHEGYCVAPDEGSHVREFRDMVKALHRAGIEVILDVVFNHTGEGNHEGPTISFRGLDNTIYYHLEPYDKQYYTNLSGCGNTFNCNHPLVEKFIDECLLFWVREMHVDGFRFDLASILSRGAGRPADGRSAGPLAHRARQRARRTPRSSPRHGTPAASTRSATSRASAGPSGTAGSGTTSAASCKGDKGIVGTVAARIAGSADIYQDDGELPINSINFITAHDGFTLNDLVSYNGKHNEANGEGNRDGTDDNLSWNCGVEGDTDDAEIEALRARQVRNFLTILMVSQGVPMMVMGDEARQTQFGNNNAYCQDNEITWFDWARAGAARGPRPVHQRADRLPQAPPDTAPLALLHGRGEQARPGRHLVARLSSSNAPGWDDPESRVLALHPRRVPEPRRPARSSDVDIHVMMNMDWKDLRLRRPRGRRAGAGTARSTPAPPSPDDIVAKGHEPPFEGGTCRVKNRSIVVLISKP